MARRIMASLKQQHEIALLLGQFCSTNEAGMSVYADGWNDASVANAVNEKLPNEVNLTTEKQVKTRRGQVYGPLPSGSRTDLDARVTALEGLVNHLVKQLEILVGNRYTKYKPPMGRPHSTPPSDE